MNPRTTCAAARVAASLLLAALPASPVRAQVLTLSEAARRALASHPSAEGAWARVAEAEESLAAARAQRLPGAQLRADLTRFEEPMIVAPLHSLDLSAPPRFDEALVQGRLGLSYTVFDGGARGARIDGARASVEAARFGRDATEMTLLQEVAAAYFGLASARAVREAAAAQTEALAEEVARAEQRFETGSTARVDVLRAGAALQDARAQLAAADARVGLAVRNLARLMDAEAADVAGRALAEPALSEVGGGGSARDEASNPVVERAERAVLAAQAGVAREAAGRWPRLEAEAGVLDFGTLTGEHVFEWQAGVRLSWPVFTGGARSASIRGAEARLRTARAELERTELEAEAAVDAALAGVTEADARAEALEAAVAQWTEVARIEALALEAGSGVQSDLLRAQASLFQAAAGLARARSDAAGARVAFARARGILSIEWLNATLEPSP